MKKLKETAIAKAISVTAFIEISFIIIIALLSYSNANDYKGLNTEDWKVIIIVFIIAFPLILKAYYSLFKEEERVNKK